METPRGMNMKDPDFTIMHVEDEALLATLVRISFESFGFNGTMLPAGRVDEALSLLDEKEKSGEPINLILTDMQLPDGTGLDVIREVRFNPFWRMTPVIVLSNEKSPGIIDGAYALGANCYVSKIPGSNRVFNSLRALYDCWIEGALLPQAHSRNRVNDAVSLSVSLRTRSADFYLSLARVFENEPDEMGFWLDRALNEGNMANLLAFFRDKLGENDMPQEVIDRFAGMQVKVKNALSTAEERLRVNPAPSPETVYGWVFALTEALDETVIIEVLGSLFPKGPVATAALKARAAVQLRELATHILGRTEKPDLRLDAEKLLAWAGLLGGEVSPLIDRNEHAM
jgi:CheY-like chemotaxis protein